MTINVKITASTLCDLLNGKFTLEACEAICQYMEDCGCEDAFMLGDIAISFSEIPANWSDDYDEDVIIAELENGNILVLE